MTQIAQLEDSVGEKPFTTSGCCQVLARGSRNCSEIDVAETASLQTAGWTNCGELKYVVFTK